MCIRDSIHIERLYKELLNEKTPIRLLKNLSNTKKIKTRIYSRSRHVAKRTSMRHVGQFEGEFSLSHSQRVALHRVLEMRDNTITCVSGPPGTGKTTLIQSVVASIWVESAIKNSKRAPVIVACGETNQSVTNIIDSFSLSDTKGEIVSKRWLPEIKAFGSYCCSCLLYTSDAADE